MNPKCQCCNMEWPDELLLEMELFDAQENQVVSKIVCQQCAEEFKQNTWELEHTIETVYDPRKLIMPKLLSTSSCF